MSSVRFWPLALKHSLNRVLFFFCNINKISGKEISKKKYWFYLIISRMIIKISPMRKMILCFQVILMAVSSFRLTDLVNGPVLMMQHVAKKTGQSSFIVSSGIADWALKFKTGYKSEYVVINIQWFFKERLWQARAFRSNVLAVLRAFRFNPGYGSLLSFSD